jgi:hypothetical protein
MEKARALTRDGFAGLDFGFGKNRVPACNSIVRRSWTPQSERGLVVGAQPLEFGLPGLPFNAAALLNPRGVKFEVA